MVDRKGEARLTEYGLALINTDQSFTGVTAPGARTPWWLAPETIAPTSKGVTGPVVESKPTDIFAFAMLAVEVFAGKVPFEGEKNDAVALRISEGWRPEKPKNAQDVGLTKEMWKILTGCWNQVPKKRPAVGEVAKRWQVPKKSPIQSQIPDGAGSEVTEPSQTLKSNTSVAKKPPSESVARE